MLSEDGPLSLCFNNFNNSIMAKQANQCVKGQHHSVPLEWDISKIDLENKKEPAHEVNNQDLFV